MRYFVRPWTGYQICIGASREGEAYTHCIPLRDTGEFGGYSNSRLTRRVVKAATQAAESLGLLDPFWRDKEGNVTMAHTHKREKKDRKPGRIMPHTDEAVNQDGTLDVAAMVAAMPDVMASFQKGEYKPLGLSVADLGNGFEAFILLRKKAGT